MNAISSLPDRVINFLERRLKTDIRYLIGGGLWLTIGQALSSLASFLLAIAFANLLPAATYGEYRYVLSVFSLLVIPALPGIETAITRAVAQGYDGALLEGFRTKVRWGVLGSLASLILAGYYFHLHNTDLTIAFLITAAFVPIFDASNIFFAFLEGKRLFRQRAVYPLIMQYISVGVLVGVLFVARDLWWILLAYFVPYVTARLISLLLILKKYRPSDKCNPQTIPYGMQLSGINVLTTIAGNLDQLLIWHFLGAVPLAIYAFAQAPTFQLRNVINNLFLLAYPKLSQRSAAELKASIIPRMLKLTLLLTPFIIAYVLFIPFVYHLVFPKYAVSIPYAQYFALILFFVPPNILTVGLEAQAKKGNLWTINIINIVSRVTLILILLPLWKLYGLITAVLGMNAIDAAVSWYYFRRI